MSPNTTPSAPRVRAAVAFFLVTPRSVRKLAAQPMSSDAGPGQTVQMGKSSTTCGGPKTLLPSDDNPAADRHSRHMPGQAISLDAGTIDPIAALKRVGGVRHNTQMRKIAIATAVVAAAIAAAVFAPGVIHKFGDAFVRALHADPGWVVGGVGFELASFMGYIALFWYVAQRATPRIGLRASSEIALASTAATRLLPTAGAGGAALTFWSLRRAGQDNNTATRTLLSFLVVLYTVFLGAIVVAGTLLATGAVQSDVPLSPSAVPAAAAAAGIALALVFALRHDADATPAGRHNVAAHALGGAVRDALSIVRRPD